MSDANCKYTISLLRLFQMFPDQEKAREYFEAKRWDKGIECPYCQEKKRVSSRKNRAGIYYCNACSAKEFTVRTGTVMENSKIPLHKWLYAMYLLMTSRKGISSLKLSKEIGITQKSAWFLLQRLRETYKQDDALLSSVVGIDETYIGGKEGNKHQRKQRGWGTGKQAVVGMQERGKGEIQSFTDERVAVGSTLHTDEHRSYSGLDGLIYRHRTVMHSAGEYVYGDVHTNGIESVWSVLKRGLQGVYHQASEKHLGRYVDEFAFRLSEGNVRRHTTDRQNDLVTGMIGKRLTYSLLTNR